MKWVVCKEKGSGWMFVVSRKMREYFIELCSKNKVEIRSVVVGEFENRNEAQRYADKINDIDALLNQII